jgi:hypothetical protein
VRSGIKVERKFHVRRGHRSRTQVSACEATSELRNRVPRVARLLALAIRFDQLIHDGTVADQATLARLGHVSRARLTQIMDLLNLAPDIQESLLVLTSPQNGRDPISEQQLRPIAAQFNWSKQRQLLSRLLAN